MHVVKGFSRLRADQQVGEGPRLRSALHGTQYKVMKMDSRFAEISKTQLKFRCVIVIRIRNYAWIEIDLSHGYAWLAREIQSGIARTEGLAGQ